jgi:hypothetical protein
MMTKAVMPSRTGNEPARLTICTGIGLPSSWAKPVTMNDTCSNSVQKRANPVQRCQVVSRSMPIRRSRNGSRAISTSWKISTRATCRPKNRPMVIRVFFSGTSEVKNSTSTNTTLRRTAAPSPSCAAKAGDTTDRVRG